MRRQRLTLSPLPRRVDLAASRVAFRYPDGVPHSAAAAARTNGAAVLLQPWAKEGASLRMQESLGELLFFPWFRSPGIMDALLQKYTRSVGASKREVPMGVPCKIPPLSGLLPTSLICAAWCWLRIGRLGVGRIPRFSYSTTNNTAMSVLRCRVLLDIVIVAATSAATFLTQPHSTCYYVRVPRL